MSPFKLFSRHGELVYELSRREVIDRYVGQTLGALWALLHPVFLMAVYIIVFGVIFGLRFDREMPLDYGVYLLAGLIPWLAVVEVLNKSSVVIAGNTALIKQVVFPVEVLPVKTVLSTMFTQLIFWLFYILYVVIDSGQASIMWLLLPVLIVLQTIFLMGSAFFVSSLATIVKDIKDVVQLFSVVGLYFLPIIYLPEMVPNWMQWALDVNPLSHMVWVYQDVMFYGAFEHPKSWWIWGGTVGVGYIIGAVVFGKLKHILANYV